jgi:excinuclease ABC subunit A
VCHTSYNAPDPRLFSYNSKHGWCPDCVGTGLLLDKTQRKQLDETQIDAKDKGREQSFAEADVEGLSDAPCPTCSGTRLNAVARGVLWHPSPAGGGQGWGLFTPLLKPSASPDASPHPSLPPEGEGVAAWERGVSITQLAKLSVADLHRFFSQLQLTGRAADIARDLLPEITSRLAFMLQVGLGYLTLDRGAPTLSGGEAQRIRLAAQLGSNLQGVCYVLDEPTIGLHARDNHILLGALRKLADQGNTLMVVEHDEDTIRQADHIIDIGPGAGRRGGQLVAQGSVAAIAANPASTTGRYLGDASRYQFMSCSGRFDGSKPLKHLEIQGVNLHNVQGLDVAVPLQQLVVFTGVSGSGKSTLARDVLLANVQAAIQSKGVAAWQHCSGLEGWQEIDRVLEVDQTPIGKTPRSCPATYIGFWDAIRKLFAETSESKARGYTASRFSFNTGAGRCPACEGQGMRTVAMSFLPDVKVPCEVCNGARFNPQTLAVHWRSKSVGDVLQMEVDEALEFFAHMPAIAHPLQLLHDVGLGYLQLGQASPTLSGGEAQRLKLVTELTKVRDEVGRRGQKALRTLYVLDEPTVGLHMADVQRIIAVLQRLVAAGHSVVVVEHDLDLITKADWLIDMGPEGGAGGGQVVAQGRPADLAAQGLSHTARALKSHGQTLKN